MQVHHELYPDKDIFEMSTSRHSMFDKVMGTNKVREMFSKNYKVADIHEFLNKDLVEFRSRAQKYYLYQ